MAYTTVDYVKAEFRSLGIDSTGFAITTANATEFIAQADAEIDARIGLRYATPVDAAASLPILRMISTMLVSARIKSVLEIKAPAAKSLEQQVKGSDPATEARKMLAEIVAGKMLLPGATLAAAGDGVGSFGVSEGLENEFKKGESQW